MDIERIKKQVRALLHQVQIEDWEKEDLLGRVDGSTPEQLEQLHDNLMRQLALDISEDYLKELNANTQLFTEENAPDVDKILDERLQQMKEKLFTEAEIDQIRSHIAEISGAPAPVATAAPSADVAPVQPTITPPVSPPQSPVEPVSAPVMPVEQSLPQAEAVISPAPLPQTS